MGASYKKLCVSAFACAVFAVSCAQPQKTKADYERELEIMHMARDVDGLHKAAQANGGSYTVVDEGEPIVEVGTLDRLVSQSQRVFTAKVISATPILADSGRDVETTYQISVDRPIVGVHGSETMVVDVPGGTYVFPDGVSATIKVLSLERLKTGHTYLMFVSLVDGHFRLVGWNEGISEVEPDGSLRAFHHSSDNPIFQELKLGLNAVPAHVQALSSGSR